MKQLHLERGTAAEEREALDRLDPSGRVRRAVKGRTIPGVIPVVENIKGVPTMTLQRPTASALHQEGVHAWTPEGGPELDRLTGAKPIEVPASVVQRMHANLPAEIRRTAREKFQELVARMYRDAERQFKVNGKVQWPASIEKELAVLGKAKGNEHLVAQVERLASHMLVKGAREQQAQDSKRVTRGWHGHLTA